MTAPVTLVVDVSCSGLIAVDVHRTEEMSPAVAVAGSVVGSRRRAESRVVCGTETDPVPAAESGSGAGTERAVEREGGRAAERSVVEPDPFARVGARRIVVSGLSLPAREVLSAPLVRCLRWAGTAPGSPIGLVVPSGWGVARTGVLVDVARGLGHPATPVRGALACAHALAGGAARWIGIVEGSRGGFVVTLVYRDATEFVLVSRRYVPRCDPVVDHVGRTREALIGQAVDAVLELRSRRRDAKVASFEILVRGLDSTEIVDECDRRGVLSFRVPDPLPAEAVMRLHGRPPRPGADG